MLATLLVCALAVALLYVVFAKAANGGLEWEKAGSWIDVSWLTSYMAGGLAPVDEKVVKGKSFLEKGKKAGKKLNK